MQDEAGIAYDTIQSREAKGKGRGDLLDICIGIKKKKITLEKQLNLGDDSLFVLSIFVKYGGI